MNYTIDLLHLSQLSPHEHHDAAHAHKLAREIGTKGVWITPILVAADTFVILDGHHRFAAARALGLDRIPCVLVEYDDPQLQVASWRVARRITKGCVRRAAREGQLMPEKTSRHKLSIKYPPTYVPLYDLMHCSVRHPAITPQIKEHKPCSTN